MSQDSSTTQLFPHLDDLDHSPLEQGHEGVAAGPERLPASIAPPDLRHWPAGSPPEAPTIRVVWTREGGFTDGPPWSLLVESAPSGRSISALHQSLKRESPTTGAVGWTTWSQPLSAQELPQEGAVLEDLDGYETEEIDVPSGTAMRRVPVGALKHMIQSALAGTPATPAGTVQQHGGGPYIRIDGVNQNMLVATLMNVCGGPLSFAVNIGDCVVLEPDLVAAMQQDDQRPQAAARSRSPRRAPLRSASVETLSFSPAIARGPARESGLQFPPGP